MSLAKSEHFLHRPYMPYSCMSPKNYFHTACTLIVYELDEGGLRYCLSDSIFQPTRIYACCY